MPFRERTCHGLLALLGALCLCLSAPVLVRAKAVHSDTGASLAASGGEPPPSAQMGPPLQLLSGEGRREWDSLSLTAKLEANKELSEMVIRPKDADVVHFSATGHLFFADPMPEIPVEKMSSAGRRRRRALSDTTPLRFQPNGKLKGGAGAETYWDGKSQPRPARLFSRASFLEVSRSSLLHCLPSASHCIIIIMTLLPPPLTQPVPFLLSLQACPFTTPI
jgi:hypothetical protein